MARPLKKAPIRNVTNPVGGKGGRPVTYSRLAFAIQTSPTLKAWQSKTAELMQKNCKKAEKITSNPYKAKYLGIKLVGLDEIRERMKEIHECASNTLAGQGLTGRSGV